jgi:urease accessory protein UreH
VSFHAAAEAPRLGEVGKWGRLVLRLARREGRTVVADQFWTLPLQYYGTLYACSPRLDAGLAARLAALMEAGAEVYAGAGQPAPGVAIARVLGPGSEAVRGLLFDAWDLLRRPLLGKPARPLRKL